MSRFLPHTQRRPRGFTLVELLISMTVALFLLGGLLTIVQSTRRAFDTQNKLAQLQDNERLALTFMAEIIESAGYFPDPKSNTAGAVLPVAGVFAGAGQALFGTFNNNVAPGDTVTVRYGAGLNDNVFNCTGKTNKTIAPYDTFVNTFSVDNKQRLMCTFTSQAIPGGQTVPLVTGVQNLTLLYGVKRSAANTQSCTDTYLNAGQMLAADWLNVCSVRLTLEFTNPLTPGAPAIRISRVIGAMNAAGVNT